MIIYRGHLFVFLYGYGGFVDAYGDLCSYPEDVIFDYIRNRSHHSIPEVL